MLCFGNSIPHLRIINHVIHDVNLLQELAIVLVHAEVRALAVGGLPPRVALVPRSWSCPKLYPE